MLSGALPAQTVPAQPLPAPAVLPKILALKGIRPDMILEKDKEVQVEDEENGKDEQVEKDVSSGLCIVASNVKSNSIECTWSIPTKSAQISLLEIKTGKL